MKFKSTNVLGTVEILAADVFQAIPATISGTNIVKAGMPVKLDGTPVPAGTGAAGILLYDVDPTIDPSAALVWFGTVDWDKCMKHSGATASAETMAGILTSVKFRTNIGVNTAADAGGGGGGSGGQQGGGT